MAEMSGAYNTRPHHAIPARKVPRAEVARLMVSMARAASARANRRLLARAMIDVTPLDVLAGPEHRLILWLVAARFTSPEINAALPLLARAVQRHRHRLPHFKA